MILDNVVISTYKGGFYMNSNIFIHNLAQRFLQHISSVNRLYMQYKLNADNPETMDIGQLVDYILHLKIKHLKAIEDNNKEVLKEIEKGLEEFREKELFNALDKCIIVTNLGDSYQYEISSTIISKAYQVYKNGKNEINYDFFQFKNSLIISLVIGVELLIADIFKDYVYNLDVKNSTLNDRTLTFYDLKNIESIDDAKEFLADQYIEKLLKGSFDSWIQELNKKLNIYFDTPELKEDVLLVTETFQRRHLIIHNDGIVNNWYINNVDSALRKDLVKGAKLELDDDYILSRIAIIRKFGLMLIYKYGLKKFKKKENELFLQYHGLLVEIIDTGCLGVRKIFSEFSEMKELDHSNQLMSKVNYFLTFKFQDDESVIKEIENFDTSVLSLEYKMARNILLDNENAINDAITFLESIKDEEFIDVFKWPLFRLIKTNPEIDEYGDKRLLRILIAETSGK